jgi:hypothetical protein
MPSTQDRIGNDGIGFSTAMARIGKRTVKSGERRIGDAGAERPVRAPSHNPQ